MNKFFSKYLTLNVRDFANGVLMAVLGAVLGTILPTLQNWVLSDNWALVFNWQVVVKTAVGAALTYIIKNGLTNSKGEFMKKESR